MSIAILKDDFLDPMLLYSKDHNKKMFEIIYLRLFIWYLCFYTKIFGMAYFLWPFDLLWPY